MKSDFDDDMIAGILDRASRMATTRRARDADLEGKSSSFREISEKALGPRGPRPLGTTPTQAIDSTTIDGAHLVEIDRGGAYSISAAVAYNFDPIMTTPTRNSFCFAEMPHLACLSDISAGLMQMQEVMLAVQASEAKPDRLVLIDGSRVSTVIAIDMFYRGLASDRPGHLARLRRDRTSDMAKILRKFEDDNWLYRYIVAPNIVGNAKLVTARRLISIVTENADANEQDESHTDFSCLDDKIVADLILKDPSSVPGGEGMGPLPIPPPRTPFRVHPAGSSGDGYPRYEDVGAALETLADRGEGGIGLFNFFIKPTSIHGVFSLEVNANFFESRLGARLMTGQDGDVETGLMKGLAAHIRFETPAVDIQEPILTHIADINAKRAVTSGKDAFQAMARMHMGGSRNAWQLLRPHRTT